MKREWDDGQRQVIEAPPEYRILVEAGPGTGKTEVACARVAFLLQQGVDPETILIFSFTRTAVSEISDRIFRLAGNEPRAKGVKITTLDSEVWHLCHGFQSDAGVRDLFADYEVNVHAATAMLEKGSEDLVEYFSRYRHVIVDEAQDLVAARGDFVFRLFGAFGPGTGITVFCDPAQAIYGFTEEDEEDESKPAKNLLHLLEADSRFSDQFIKVGLTKVYRSSAPGLLKVFSEVRPILSSGELGPAERFEQVREYIQEQVEHIEFDLDDDAIKGFSEREMLMLYRSRHEVLRRSSELFQRKIPHRIRIGNMLPCIAPWVAVLLGRYSGPAIDKDRFDTLWARKFSAGTIATPERDAAWTLLRRYCGSPRGEAILVKDLRRILARSRPPIEFLLPEIGRGGMILGTIHASKGREADLVSLMMPKGTGRNLSDEESRVLYVGATRAKHDLKVGEGLASQASSLYGRVYRKLPDQTAQVEFGLPTDFDTLSVASNEGLLKPQHAGELQDYLATVSNSFLDVVGRIGQSDWAAGKFDYQLFTRGGGTGPARFIGKFNQSVNQNLFEISNAIEPHKRRPSERIEQLQLFGCRTFALSEDSPQRDLIHSEFSDSGIFLVPIIRGFAKVFFPYRSGGAR